MSESLPHQSRLDPQAATALGYTAVALTLLEFFAMPGALAKRGVGMSWFPGTPDLGAGMAWVASTTLLLLAGPLLLHSLVFKASPLALGWSARGFGRHLRVYVGLLLMMVPVIVWAASQPQFLLTYPLVEGARHDVGAWWMWEAAYVFQFLAVESFFRGYLLFSCERAMGRLAV